MQRLVEIVANLSSYDSELTIYAAEPWTCNANAVVAREPDSGEVPSEAAVIAASYVIEVSIAKELLEAWRKNERPHASAHEQCERLIHYAIHDA